MACHELFCLLQEKLAERTHFGVRVYAERFHCSSMASLGACFPSLCCCCCRRSNSKKSLASLSLQLFRSATNFLACSRVDFVTVGREYGFFFLSLASDSMISCS